MPYPPQGIGGAPAPAPAPSSPINEIVSGVVSSDTDSINIPIDFSPPFTIKVFGYIIPVGTVNAAAYLQANGSNIPNEYSEFYFTSSGTVVGGSSSAAIMYAIRTISSTNGNIYFEDTISVDTNGYLLCIAETSVWGLGGSLCRKYTDISYTTTPLTLPINSFTIKAGSIVIGAGSTYKALRYA